MPKRNLQIIPLALAAILTLLSVSAAARAQSKDAPAAPVPAQISAAKKVFISNAGSDVNPFGPFSQYTGLPSRPYNEFYAAMKSWGRFDLVAAPADADLILEIRFTDPSGPPSVASSKTTAPYGSQELRVAVLDPRTHFTLWAITEYLPVAILQSNRDKNFDRAMISLVSDIKSLM